MGNMRNMKKLEKLKFQAIEEAKKRREKEIRETYDRMTLEQLRELAEGNPTEERIREIFASVNGLHLLEEY